MNNIVPVYEKFVNNDGLEFVVDTASGLAYSSIRGTARILGVDDKTVRNYLARTADLIDVINAEIPTTTGLKTAVLIDAVTLYDMALQYNLPLAKKMGVAGANLFLLGMSGYKVKIVEAPVTPVRQLAPQRDLKDWIEAMQIMGLTEDPILKSLVAQRMAEQLGNGEQPQDAPESPLNITSIAHNLGYSQAEIGTGAALGKWVAKFHKSEGYTNHGKYQVNTYYQSEVAETLAAYFNRK